MTTKRWLIAGITLEGIVSFIVYFPALVFKLMGKGYLATQGCDTVNLWGIPSNSCVVMYSGIGGILMAGLILIGSEWRRAN